VQIYKEQAVNGDHCFDRVTDRQGTGSHKWDEIDKGEGKLPVIPLWVADMDFPSPQAVTEALMKRAAHPVYGYTRVEPSYYEALAAWYKTQYGAELMPGDFVSGSGTVPGLGTAVRTWSDPGDGVLLLTPVYHPFFDSIRHNGRVTVEAPLKLNGEGRYCFDLARMDRALTEAESRGLKIPLMLFCSPHNPGGSVWTRAELEGLLDFAGKRNMVIAVDEIHGDFVYAPETFVSLSTFQEHARRVVVLSAPSKTFNLGGLHVSHFVSRDEKLREAVKNSMAAEMRGGPDIFSLTAAEASYRYGAEWLAALRIYIRANIEEAADRLNAEVPGLRAYKPQGTYLVWADASELISRMKLGDDPELVRRLETEGRVKVTPGSAFGSRGRGFLRINTACPRSILDEALNRIAGWARL
jgi:cystathionine beta-lyase